MADADVAITAGSGTKIDTRTVGAGTDEHRQVVVIGDPTTAANVGAVSAAGRLSVDASGVAVPVTDNSGSLTVDSTQWPAALVGGRLDVNIGASGLSSLAVANVETLVDNAGFTDGTSKVFPQGYIFDETAGTSLTENDVGAARMDSKRAIVNVLEDATTRGRRAIVSASGGLLGDQGAPATQANAWFVRPRKLATYRAVYRTTTAGTRVLAPAAFTAGARKQFATIHHAASATKTVRLRSVQFSMESTSVAGRLHVDLVRITAAPATGNPAITPGISDNADAAAEATCLALPTTAGTEGTVFSYQPYNLGVTGTRSVISPPVVQPWVELLDRPALDDESKSPVIRAGVLEGWAVTVEAEAATSAAGFVMIEFTEE